MLVLGNAKKIKIPSPVEQLQCCSVVSVCVTLRFLFSHPNLVIYLFPTSPMKLKLGLQIGWRLPILPYRNPHGPINVPSQSTASVKLCCAFYLPQQKLYKNVGPKPFCWSKPAECFNFTSSNFNLQSHILSTCGVADRWEGQGIYTQWTYKLLLLQNKCLFYL
jgi:hypothetical protein